MYLLLQRLEDLARLGIDFPDGEVILRDQRCGAEVHGVALDHVRHLLDHGALLTGEHALHGELRLGEVDAGLGVRLADGDPGDHLVDAASPGQEALHIVGELLEGARGQVQHHREDLTLAQDIEHAAVLAGLPLSLTGAVLVVRAVPAAAAGVADAGHTVKAAAVRGIVAALVLAGVVGEGGVVVQDHAGEVFHHLRLVPIAGQLQDGRAACGELDAVQLEVRPLAVLRHDVLHQNEGFRVGVASQPVRRERSPQARCSSCYQSS